MALSPPQKMSLGDGKDKGLPVMRGEERTETEGRRERRVDRVFKGDFLEEVGVALSYHLGEKEGRL